MARFQPFEERHRLAVAVSGGNDSMALLKLADLWVKARGGNLTAFHVDHGLRTESSQEAIQVKTWAEALDIPCSILKWTHGPISSRIQQKARDARYQLLLGACKEEKILHLLVAHHRDDDLETLQIRQEAQSGEWGLAGMAACQEFESVRILRPLLDFTKEELRQVLGNHPHVEDPSNENLRFRRVQLRQKKEFFEDSLLETLGTYKVQRQEQEGFLLGAMSVYVSFFKEGYAVLDPRFMAALPPSLSLKLLGYTLRCMGGLEYLPRQEALQRALTKLEKSLSATCGGCQLKFIGGKILVIREARAKPVLISSQTPFLWDKRFWIENISEKAVGLEVGRLGPQGWLQVKKDIPISTSSMIAQTFPTLWRGGGTVEVPFFSKEPLIKVCFRPRNSLLASLFV